MPYSSRDNTGLYIVLWGLVISCGLALAWAELSDQAPQGVENQYSTSRYARTAENDIKRFCVSLTGIDAAKCAYDIEKTERENHSAQKDLRAQRYMAIYAGAMALFAFFTLLVTALGVHFVRKTLIQTAATNSAAIEAAKAANRANKIMRDEQRPWLDFKFSETCELGFPGERSASLAGLNPLITNKGKSPAVRVWLSLRLIETNMTLYEANEFESVVREDERGVGFGRTVFPSEEVPFAPGIHGFDRIERIDPTRDAKYPIAKYVVAVIKYQTPNSESKFWTGKLFICTGGDDVDVHSRSVGLLEGEFVSEYR